MKRLSSLPRLASISISRRANCFSPGIMALTIHTSLPAAACFTTQTHPLSYRSTSVKSDTHKLHPPTKRKKLGKHSFIPQKAAVQLTEQARDFFQNLLKDPPRPEIIGIRLNYDQSKQDSIRMVFSFEFVTANDLSSNDEPVSLEVLEDGVTPKTYVESVNDGFPKLYVSGDAFLKVLGAEVDVDTKTLTPILRDREGNIMDPNA
jgi:hypothetical protein